MKVVCKCGNAIIVSPDDCPEWEIVETAEREMGNENNYETIVPIDCDICHRHHNVKINAWEYPEGSFNYDEYETEEAEIKEKFDISFPFPNENEEE